MYIVHSNGGDYRRNRKHLQHVPDHTMDHESNTNSDTAVDKPDPPDIAANSEPVLNSSACTPKKSSFERIIKPVEKLDL